MKLQRLLRECTQPGLGRCQEGWGQSSSWEGGVWSGREVGFCSTQSRIQIPTLLSPGAGSLGMLLSFAHLCFLSSAENGDLLAALSFLAKLL